MPSLLLNLDKHSHFPYLLDIEMTVFYRDDFLKILYITLQTLKLILDWVLYKLNYWSEIEWLKIHPISLYKP